jgi:hypothetical protein
MQGNTILLKQDNGSYQLLRISPAQPGGQVTPSLTPTGGSTIRLQTVPAVSRFPGPTLALRKTILTQQVKQNKQNVNPIFVDDLRWILIFLVDVRSVGVFPPALLFRFYHFSGLSCA